MTQRTQQNNVHTDPLNNTTEVVTMVDMWRHIITSTQVDMAARVDQVDVVAKVLDCFLAVDTQRYL